MDIRFGEIYTVTVRATEVRRAGQRAIINRLTVDYATEETAIPPNWDWNWMVQEGEFRGKLPKRIASFFKKQYGITISPEDVAFFGNIARRHCHVEKTYIFDFTKNFDWRSGDFGDSGSCFWGARIAARKVLMTNGAIAVRFYKDHHEGFARAWIVLHQGGIVVFNAYGLPCRTIANVLGTLFDTPPPQKVDMRISGDPDGLIWLNEDACTVGLDVDSFITLEFDVPYKWCSKCEEFAHVDNFVGEMCEACTQFHMI